jgi:hypothetical protein
VSRSGAADVVWGFNLAAKLRGPAQHGGLWRSSVTVAVAKQYHNNLQWVTADPSPSSTLSTRESYEHDRGAIGYTHRLTRAAETALCASARA